MDGFISGLFGGRSEVQLCAPLRWFDGGGGKLLLKPLCLAQCGLLGFVPIWK